jgi:hypothetical protein
MRFFGIGFFHESMPYRPLIKVRNSYIFFREFAKYSCMKFDFPRIICRKSKYLSQLHHVFLNFFFKI